MNEFVNDRAGSSMKMFGQRDLGRQCVGFGEIPEHTFRVYGASSIASLAVLR
jgi:hypothetical protein